MAKKSGQSKETKQPDDGFAQHLAIIELDDGYIEGLRAVVGDRLDWFFDAANGAIPELTEAERGRAAYIYGRLVGEEGLSRLAMLAEHDMPLVRGNAIGAIGVVAGRAAEKLLLGLATKKSRPTIDRLQALNALRLRSDADVIELSTIDLTNDPEEFQYRSALLLEQRGLGKGTA